MLSVTTQVEFRSSERSGGVRGALGYKHFAPNNGSSIGADTQVRPYNDRARDLVSLMMRLDLVTVCRIRLGC